MDKYKRFYGLFLFIIANFALIYFGIHSINPLLEKKHAAENEIVKQRGILSEKKKAKLTVEKKIEQLSNASQKAQKKIFSPIETDLGDDSLFFALYNDVLEMIHSNSVRIKKMDYVYNPEDDPFVKHGKDKYFVSDINFELVSNYVNLGKLVQNLYQYPYYIKINNISVEPYKKDKTILLTNLSLRLYAYTEPALEEDESKKMPAKVKQSK